jgi:hypothetical protein
MLFTLEALPARFGDALLLHFGDPADPQLIVIDGGTTTVYKRSLRPRLDALQAAHRARVENADPMILPEDPVPLPVRMVMVSHLDDDHIRGILDWTDELVELQEDNQALPHDIATFWHNSFDDVVGNQEIRSGLEAHVGDGVTAASSAAGFTFIPELKHFRSGALVLASVDQGRKLRKNIEALKSGLNEEVTGDLIFAPESGRLEIDLQPGLKLTVLGPLEAELRDLEAKWNKELPKILAKEGRERQAEAAAFADSSVFNLSSIVVLAEAGGKRMLLTGDARGDLVLKGLENAGLMDAAGNIHVDLLKMPHHGSIRNVDDPFFQRIQADHYVISSDGDRFNNPDLATLEMMSRLCGDRSCTIHLTYPAVQRQDDNDKSDGFAPDFDFAQSMALFERDRQAQKPYQVRFREAGSTSVKVDLGTDLLSF